MIDQSWTGQTDRAQLSVPPYLIPSRSITCGSRISLPGCFSVSYVSLDLIIQQLTKFNCHPRPQPQHLFTMHLMYTLDPAGNRCVAILPIPAINADFILPLQDLHPEGEYLLAGNSGRTRRLTSCGFTYSEIDQGGKGYQVCPPGAILPGRQVLQAPSDHQEAVCPARLLPPF